MTRWRHGRDLEGHAVVVAFGRVAPTPCRRDAAARGLLPAWETEHLLGQTGGGGGRDDAACCAQVQCVGSSAASFFGRRGSPPLPKTLSTKSRLQTRLPGAKKAHLHRFLGDEALHGGTYHRAKQQRDKAFRPGPAATP